MEVKLAIFWALLMGLVLAYKVAKWIYRRYNSSKCMITYKSINWPVKDKSRG